MTPDIDLRRTCVALSTALLLVSVSTPAVAQTIQGRVIDGSTREPLSGARLTLLHPDGSTLGEPVVSGAQGEFLHDVPGVGDYFLRVEKVGYTPIVDGIFEFTAVEGRMSIEIFLLPRPLELEGIDVRVQREKVRRKLRRSGFYDRAATGFGDFVTPEKIEQIGETMNVSDYMRGIPGINFYGGLVLMKTDSPSRSLVGTNGSALGMCEPNVWIDGVRMTPAADLNSENLDEGSFGSSLEEDDLEQSLDDYVHPQDVIAIEVFRRATSTPLQWGGVGSTCGTILIWTKAGTG